MAPGKLTLQGLLLRRRPHWKSAAMSGRVAARGFTLVWVLATIAVLGIGLAQVGPMWADAAKREREADLIRIGTLYAAALAAYKQAAPGTLKRYPETLEDLLFDQRMMGTKRWMRKLYGDPMRPGRPWAVIRDPEGRISGVFSTSEEEPLRREPQDLGVTRLPAAKKYSEWRFTPETRDPQPSPTTTRPERP